MGRQLRNSQRITFGADNAAQRRVVSGREQAGVDQFRVDVAHIAKADEGPVAKIGKGYRLIRRPIAFGRDTASAGDLKIRVSGPQMDEQVFAVCIGALGRARAAGSYGSIVREHPARMRSDAGAGLEIARAGKQRDRRFSGIGRLLSG